MKNIGFDWAVIGAGPAGIAAVGRLIDHGVEPKKIAWVDPEFEVGDFGTKWQCVKSNTQVGLFIKFLNVSPAFKYKSAEQQFEIGTLDPLSTCHLSFAAEPLQWVTNHLKETVATFQDQLQSLKLHNKHWELTLNQEKLNARQVILAVGSEPSSLSFPGFTELPLAIALNPEKLQENCDENDVIAVFGSSHSAMIILKTLLEECSVKKVINFYLSPLQFAVYFDDWILFDNTGLKGETAAWVRNNIHDVLPQKLERVLSNEANIKTKLPLCNKVIYATGFKRRQFIVEGFDSVDYSDRTGIIAPGLFGLGIAFPEAKADPYGQVSHQVGLWKFMDYLNRVMPLWLNYRV